MWSIQEAAHGVTTLLPNRFSFYTTELVCPRFDLATIERCDRTGAFHCLFAIQGQSDYIPCPMDTRWIVVTTKAGQECWAIENLARQNCPYYFPKITELVRTRKKRELSIRPLFPRHVFVEVDMAKRWKFVTGTLGVRGVIMQGENPGFVPRREIEKLKALEDQDGMIVLPQLRTFDENQQVRINGGMLEGYTGLYQGQHSLDREKVLISLLGRKVSVLIDSRYLEAA